MTAAVGDGVAVVACPARDCQAVCLFLQYLHASQRALTSSCWRSHEEGVDEAVWGSFQPLPPR